MSVTVTERAIEEVKKVMEEQKFSPDTHVLRVSCQGGGCSGFMYSLGFEKLEEGDPLNDTISEFFGVNVKLDRRVETLIDGTEVDFYSGLDKRGFTFKNPLATRGCGCGQSFGV